VAALGLSVAVAVLTLQVRAWVVRLKLRRRFDTARRGQEDAEDLLQRLGFRIVGRQTQVPVNFHVDGVPVDTYVQSDLLVLRHGRRAIVEVKTGQKAPDPNYIPTRRQLLEYAVTWPGHDVYLLDMHTQRLIQVAFPDVQQPGLVRHSMGALVGAFVVGAASPSVCLYVWTHWLH
jgi:hypothetical protein